MLVLDTKDRDRLKALQVKSTPSTGIPASSRIRGLTTMMYAMVTNVVRPASNSCRTVVWRTTSAENARPDRAWSAFPVPNSAIGNERIFPAKEHLSLT